MSVLRWGEKRSEDGLVSFGTGHFLAIVIEHGDVPSIIRASERDDLVLPMSLFAQQLVYLVIQISHLVVGQTSYTGSNSAKVGGVNEREV